jgi:uncharacterized protein YndB with AHSA1/START domain
MTIDRIEREIVIDAPRERVWAVLTEADHVAQWFGDSAEVDLRPGGRAVFTWTKHGGSHEARIERVEPPGFFSYRWAHQAGDAVADGTSTLVEFTLTPDGTAGTRLRVVETGFAALAGGDEERSTAVKENTEGWARELGELKDYAERAAA